MNYVDSGSSLRAAATQYNVPFETLRRRVNRSVDMGCKSGPSTVLTSEEEHELVKYAIEMADRGFAITPGDIKRLAYKIVDRADRKHPFVNGMAGQTWFRCFKKRHPNLGIKSPQPLSLARARACSGDVIDNFFSKLGSYYARLNLLTKPMMVYNIDETGIKIVHKPAKVIAEVGRKHLYSLTSGERGKTHTVVVCVSANGSFIPPMTIYPRKTAVPSKFKEGAVPGTLFGNSVNGWINQELYLEWFKFFIASIPSARPVLLIEDGHSSHITIEVIELARQNDIHLLCLPSHTSHVLQPLDIGVFKSFKSHFSKCCSTSQYMMKNPGRVVTTEALASIIGKAWPLSITPFNIMSGV